MAPKRQIEDKRVEISLTVRFPADLLEEAKRFAGMDERSFNTYAIRAIRAQVEQDRKRFAGVVHAERKAGR